MIICFLQRILNVQYSIPDYVHISPECRRLISRIFVADPALVSTFIKFFVCKFMGFDGMFGAFIIDIHLNYLNCLSIFWDDACYYSSTSLYDLLCWCVRALFFCVIFLMGIFSLDYYLFTCISFFWACPC